MGSYDIQQVCLNGHQVTDSYNQFPADRSDFCDKCGSETITHCPNCNQPIRGDYISDALIIGGAPAKVPDFCSNCGLPYPWAKDKPASADQVSTGPDLPLDKLDYLCSKIHVFAKEIKNRHANRETVQIDDEYDLQDVLRSLLRMFFRDVRPEDYAPSYAGSCSRIDYVLRQERVAVEVKHTSKTLSDKKIGEQLMIDMDRYKDHPHVETLYCFVYDPEGHISNAAAIEDDLSGIRDNFETVVKIYPKH